MCGHTCTLNKIVVPLLCNRTILWYRIILCAHYFGAITQFCALAILCASNFAKDHNFVVEHSTTIPEFCVRTVLHNCNNGVTILNVRFYILVLRQCGNTLTTVAQNCGIVQNCALPQNCVLPQNSTKCYLTHPYSQLPYTTKQSKKSERV